jgi:hypothetical protein
VRLQSNIFAVGVADGRGGYGMIDGPTYDIALFRNGPRKHALENVKDERVILVAFVDVGFREPMVLELLEWDLKDGRWLSTNVHIPTESQIEASR